jgi:hypothetical protein
MTWSPKRRVHKSKERKDSIGLSVGNETDRRTRYHGLGQTEKWWKEKWPDHTLAGVERVNGQGDTGRGKVARATKLYPSF